jgi:hypothetical protein
LVDARCTAEKAPEPEPNSSDLDNSPDSEDLLGRLGDLLGQENLYDIHRLYVIIYEFI